MFLKILSKDSFPTLQKYKTNCDKQVSGFARLKLTQSNLAPEEWKENNITICTLSININTTSKTRQYINNSINKYKFHLFSTWVACQNLRNLWHDKFGRGRRRRGENLAAMLKVGTALYLDQNSCTASSSLLSNLSVSHSFITD